jgi:hypothetical protein
MSDAEMNRQPSRKVSFWKLGLGLLLILAEVKSWLTPDDSLPDALKYANATQQIAGRLVSIAVLAAGVLLVFFGLRAIWSRGTQKD